ncbi:UNVERIFIED_CONTAM: hypothetical protein Slati_1032500 [Sesamum latifolium]|uniref:Transmembrane protein n=1 Tax=Sesamum latifolium TaxID=2727402 RepID=A0AAW2XSN5_9LAMI
MFMIVMSSASYLSGNDDDEYVQTRLNAPMPWIGVYVAAASVACSLAMAADVVYGFRCKKLWFPCKFFSLNATSLTLLAVALKLPVDLTTNMWAVTDRLAKLSSLAFMSTATANFVTSLGSMSDQDIIMSVTALSILDSMVRYSCLTTHHQSISDEVDEVFEIGRTQRSNSLLQFLSQSHSFNGVIAFDSNQVPSVHYREPPNCSTGGDTDKQTAIRRESVDGLLSNIRRGLSYAKLIEKCLYNSGDLANIRKAAEIWTEVELHRKWQGVDLGKLSRESENSKKSLENLATVAVKTVLDFKRKTGGCLMMSNPLNWPDNIVSANSMYRISQTILSIYNQSDHHDDQQQADQHLFQLLSDMIADILSACLTNLSRVITIKCHHNAIEERERSVGEAALLLGETEDILELLWRRELPISSDSEQAAYIDGWRSVMELENGIQLNALSSSENDPPENSGDHVFITIMEG